MHFEILSCLKQSRSEAFSIGKCQVILLNDIMDRIMPVNLTEIPTLTLFVLELSSSDRVDQHKSAIPIITTALLR